MSSQHIVFTFAGQGFPPVEAARDLYRTSKVFQHAIRDVQNTIDRLLQEQAIQSGRHIPLTEYLEEDQVRPPYATSFDQPPATEEQSLPPSETVVILAAQYALGKMLQSWDISPRSVMAYSLGELVASTFTGSYTLPAVMKLLARREALFTDRSLIPHKGALALVHTDGDRVKQILATAGLLGTVDIAGFSNPVTTCLAGDAEPMEVALEKFEAAEVDIRRVKLEVGMHSQHVQALADHVRSSPTIFPIEDSVDCKVVPGIDHWSSLGFQMPTGAPLNVNHYATLLRRPLRYKECVEGIYRKHMKEQPEQELVFIDMGMGPGQLYKSIMFTLKDTPEWQVGQVKATASIDPVEAGDGKTKLGWATSQLKDHWAASANNEEVSTRP
ncbi:hypothetical protein QM012_005072 [Aureobasidium pullulans]|uniref:Malonyl-CoA:ACP transacylase (MAT) domain-containing protein n=1 Tax=Aureobasidium pullulans TaxID=5580 RepID=A0ABR0T6K7_AURPU